MVEGPLVSDKKKGTKKNQLVNEESHLLEFMFFVKLCQVLSRVSFFFFRRNIIGKTFRKGIKLRIEAILQPILRYLI